jgi:hypothetical protein
MHKHHAEGLEKIIAIRGGMRDVARDGLLYGMVIWYCALNRQGKRLIL